ncbi:MAG TPA: OmpA family protein [Saprospiraceae bacterium]|nr:OmpA family protein [Saprospiraceae bacterium]
MNRIFIIFYFFLATITVGLGQHSLKKIDYPVNSDHLDEICPVVSYDEDILFFTRVADPNCEKTLFVDSFDVFLTMDETKYNDKLKQVFTQIAAQPIADPYASSYNQDIWYTKLKNSETEGIFHPGYPINDVLPNSICANFGKQHKYLVINQFATFGGIDRGFSMTEKSGIDFKFPTPIHIKNFTTKSNEVNITASLDTSVLILAMITKDSFVHMDLFVSFHSGDHNYSEPIHMGNGINSPYRESTPMLTHDGKRLYFTSDRPGGYGGKDIYYSDRLDFTYTKWSVPQKLNPPVNSIYDDSHPHLLKDNDVIYFTSNRDRSSDIFKAKLLRQKLEKEIVITFHMINGETGKKMVGELSWGEAYKDKREGFFRAKDGICGYKFFENKPMSFIANNRNYKSQEVIIDPQELANAGIYEQTVELILYADSTYGKKVEVPKVVHQNEPAAITEQDLKKTIMLDNIYFERAKPIVLTESYPSIDKLAEVLLTRPKLYIQIVGHTDNVGDKEALRILSEQRAEAIKTLLIERGVPSARIDTHGYGDTKPLGPNDTEANKSKNRRVEIKIISQ